MKPKPAVLLPVILCLAILLPLTPKASSASYTANAFWFCENGTGWPAPNGFILKNNLPKVVDDLSNNGFQFAIVCVGYWNATIPSAPNVVFYNAAQATWVDAMTNYRSYYVSVINGFHAKNIKVIGFIEDYIGSMDLTAGNRPNIYNALIPYMDLGFDGYDDDVEGWTGSHQVYIDYLNNLTVFLHNGSNFANGQPRLNMPAVGYDWQQNTNPYLHVDYICCMFYGGASLFDPANPYSSQAAGYWQENFGVGTYAGSPPASPLLLGIMNFPGNTYPLSWQLAQVSNYISLYGAPNLAGIVIWNYEYMAVTNPNDWTSWNSWRGLQTVTTSQSTQTQQLYGSITVMGIKSGQNVSFSAWIDGTAPVQVLASGYTFTGVPVGSHTVHASFNGTTWDVTANVANGMTTNVPFNFDVAPQPQPPILLVLLILGVTVVGVVLYYKHYKRKKSA